MITRHTHPGPYWQCRERPVPGCRRCTELSTGAPARQGWRQQQQARDQAFTRALAAHDCARAGCLPVCTFGDW